MVLNVVAEKTEMFLELFGNTLIRSSTVSYLSETANFLIHAVTDPEFLKLMLPCFNITALKVAQLYRMAGMFVHSVKAHINA